MANSVLFQRAHTMFRNIVDSLDNPIFTNYVDFGKAHKR